MSWILLMNNSIVEIHNPNVKQFMEMVLKESGFKTIAVRDLREMKAAMEDVPNADIYLMDASLGRPYGPFVEPSVEPSVEIYNAIKERIEKGEAKFYALSGLDEILDMAAEGGVPREHLVNKGNSKYLYEILKGVGW